MGCLGSLMLLPFGIASLLTMKIANYCIKMGGIIRLLGVLSSIILGGICIWLGYWGAFEGYTETRIDGLYQVTYPVWGWIGIVIGGILILYGSLRVLLTNKQQLELEEEEERLKKEQKEDAWRALKQMARNILEQENIDDLETYKKLVQYLEQKPSDSEASELAGKLRKLKKKQDKLLR